MIFNEGNTCVTSTIKKPQEIQSGLVSCHVNHFHLLNTCSKYKKRNPWLHPVMLKEDTLHILCSGNWVLGWFAVKNIRRESENCRKRKRIAVNPKIAVKKIFRVHCSFGLGLTSKAWIYGMDFILHCKNKGLSSDWDPKYAVLLNDSFILVFNDLTLLKNVTSLANFFWCHFSSVLESFTK